MHNKSKTFFKAFNQIFTEGTSSRAKAIRYYTSNPLFTKFIIKQINNIISDHKYNYQNEYFRIDASGWNPNNAELSNKPNNFNRHLWDLQIAVEHENDPKDWLDEIIKLAHVCCPLRVVIGYLSIKNFNDNIKKYETLENYDLEYLNYASSALSQLECNFNLQHGEFMVIIGNSDTKGKKEDYFNYRAYVYEDNKFIPLT